MHRRLAGGGRGRPPRTGTSPGLPRPAEGHPGRASGVGRGPDGATVYVTGTGNSGDYATVAYGAATAGNCVRHIPAAVPPVPRHRLHSQ